jgi:hypothetical protein
MDSHKVHENYLPKLENGEPLKILTVEVKKLFVKYHKFFTFSSYNI